MKLIYAIIPLLLSPVSVSSILKNISERNMDTANMTKVLDIDFDNNDAVNNINNKVYTPTKNTAKYVSSLKGNSFEPNDSVIGIPFSDINLDNNTNTITVSFLFKWEGIDTTMMPISIKGYNGHNNLWVKDGVIGFNTGNSEIYGVKTPLEKNKYYSIVAEFNNGDISKNKLYIDGVKQDLSYVLGTSSISHTWDSNSIIGIAGSVATTNYNINDKSIIDEVKIFKKSLTLDEINSVTNSYKIPRLTTETVNNTYPKLSWTSEILDEDLIWYTGFEEGDYIPSYLPTKCNTFDLTEYYSGLRSAKVEDSALPGIGNFKYPNTDNWTSRMVYNNIYGLKPGMKFSASLKLKNTGDTSSISLIPESTTLTKNTEDFHTAYGIAEPIIVGDDTNGSSFIPIENFDYFYSEMKKKGNFVVFVANKVDNNYGATSAHIYPANIDVENKGINFGSPTYYKKGDVLQKIFLCYPLSLGGKVINTTNEWVTYNFNGTMQDLGDNYDIANKGLKLIFETKNTGSLYIDDFKLGHATKVRLYRNDNLIYEGYESDFSDTTSIDKVAPTAVSNINSNMTMIDTNTSTRKLTLTFDESEDLASIYNYQISAISKDGVETPKSSTESLEIMSGLKGYSYVIDKNSNTNPDNSVDTTSTTIEKEITDTGVYYLHIKAIDNAGNSSNTIHYKIDIPTLTAKANSSEDMIRLDWAMDDKNNKTFKVYQKKPGSNEFQTISMTDLDKSKKVKVLNIYPVGSGAYNIPNQASGATDLAGKVEKSSASLKEWVKDYGMGLIDVDSINQNDFDADPQKWLKNSDGTYKYDVIAVGFWNIGETEQHLSDNSIEYIREFIQSGRGVLTGHHHLGLWDLNSGMNRLKDEFGVKFVVETDWDKRDNLSEEEKSKIDYILPEVSKNRYSSRYWYNSDKVKAEKKGLLLNYPYNISEEGRIFNIPFSHNANDFVTGDVWLSFIPGNGYYGNNDEPVKNITQLPDGTVGTKSAYLSTYNNTALIQTGHSGLTNGTLIATEDEKKILVNTLFYLNQLSNENYLDDYSGQDINAPNMPQIYEHKFTEDGFIELNFNSVIDNGSTYEYYVESQNKDNNNLTLSNVITETITSGLKGYSYVVDNNPNTVPDNTIEQSTNETLKIKTNNNDELYVHIKAIDNVGNSSETYHYRVTDMTKPTINLSLEPNDWTNGSVTINISATDNESGIKYITLPNGNIIKGTIGSYTVTQNGKYYFKATDYMGNETISSIFVTNIDKNKPTVIINNNQNWTNQDVSVTITATDK